MKFCHILCHHWAKLEKFWGNLCHHWGKLVKQWASEEVVCSMEAHRWGLLS
ncbi:MAG: hypothetical protein Q4A00_06315 [Flavobacteriaceae bacterium]|nr:hypothetical protein [Flavobacteriaceae bacterium]